MIALLLTLATFLVFWLIGLGLLEAVRADTTCLRIVLTAPALGTAAMLLPLFVLSHAGVPIASCALPVTVVLVASATVVLLARRPRLPLAVAPVFAICVLGLILVGWPMLSLDFRWIANANDDMANYVLSATQLLHHGLLAPLDVEGLSHDQNYASATQSLHNAGSRPGADIMLAALSELTGRNPYEVFMPLIVALNLVAICGAGALAMQAARRWWAACLAALLLVVSPLGTFGVLQQLLPQVWGLGLATALFALLMRRELHQGKGAEVGQLVAIGILATATITVYVELASTVVAAYAFYVGVLVIRREVAVRAIAHLWAAPLVFAAVVLNTYLIRELQYVSSQATAGLAKAEGASLFGFTLVPSALPGLVGLLRLPPSSATAQLGVFIVFSMVLLACVLAASLLTALRGYAASVVFVTYAVLGLVLWSRSSDFGVYKLYMYLQPFLAAVVAVLVSTITRKYVLAFVSALLMSVIILQLSTQREYVDASRHPVDLPNASGEDLLPAFRRFVHGVDVPIIAVTENPTLGKLEAASVGSRPLYFISKDLFANLLGYSKNQTSGFRRSLLDVQHLDGWRPRSFDLHTPRAGRVNAFEDNTHASTILTGGRCAVVLPTGSQVVLNRRTLPEGSPNIVMRSCTRTRNLLVFTTSELGQAFYLPQRRQDVSLYQLERDSFDQSRTMSGLGRFVLFRILGPAGRVRLAIDFTKTLRHDGSNRLPPATVVGDSRTRFDLVGRGSARVVSEPVRPQMIGGHPYILLDMGQDGQLLRDDRRGVQGLFRRSVVVDPRYLTSYVRDISLVSDNTYRSLRAPSVLRRFPADLANPNLEYSGIYEDGWVSEESYVLLAAGRPSRLVVRADVLAGLAQRLQVRVDGKLVFSEPVRPGSLNMSVPLPASKSRRRVGLRWAKSIPLNAPDLRPVAALLRFIGLVPTPRR